MIHLDIAIACLWSIRSDTEEDDLPILSKLLGLQYIITKSLTGRDHVVGRTSEYGFVQIDPMLEEIAGDESEGRSGISFAWLDDDMIGVESSSGWYMVFIPCHGSSEGILALFHGLIEMLLDEWSIGFIGTNEDALLIFTEYVSHSIEGLLQEAIA